jgi:hypothetical protein
MAMEQALGTLPADDSRLVSQLHAFQSILVLVIATEYWSRLIKEWDAANAFLVISPIAITALGASVLLGRRRRGAFLGIAAVVVSFLTIVFPAGGNHEYLELVLCLLCAALDFEAPEERRLLVDAVRWMTIVILFWAGVQKLVHGFYFEGQYLAYSVSRESYASVFSWLLPADELARLAAYDGSPGTGPYLTRDRLFLMTSNLTCILEIALVPLLLFRRTRRAGVFAALVLLVAIESAARELFFFFILLNMLLLFVDSDANRHLIAPLVVILGLMLLVRLGLLPEVTFN